MIRPKKMDNRGSAFVIVLVIMTFVGVLATILLSMSNINASMKKVDATSKDTFYDAETALNEVTLGIENIMAEAANDAYSDIMTEFTTLTNDERNQRFQDIISNKLVQKLKFNETVYDSSGRLPVATELQGFITNSSANIVSVSSCTKISNYLKINSIKIVYVDGEYSSTITTDIRINLPTADLSATIPSTSTLSFEKFGLICENQLLVDNKALTVNGDVYAGLNGMYINGAASDVQIVAENIISKGDIGIYSSMSTNSNHTNFSVARKSATNNVNIWAKNIKVYDNPKYGEFTHSYESIYSNKKNTDIEILGANIKVADDLELSSPSSKVILNGTYFGFGYSQTDEPQSSSITINGRNSSLDIRGLRSLQLAGRSFITAPASAVANDTEQKYADIVMGESLSIRGNQIAYLLPSACLSLKHNPITATERNNVTIDIQAANTDSFHLEDYVVAGNETRTVYYKKASGGTVIYYYLNIIPGKETEFFKAYCETFGTDRMAQIFDLSGLKTNTSIVDGVVQEGSSISAPGTVVAEYITSTTDADSKETIFDPGDGGVPITAVEVSKNFKYWTSYLKSSEDEAMTQAGYSVSKGVVENMINVDLIHELNSLNPSTNIIMDKVDSATHYRVIIVDNYGKATFAVPKGMVGMVIATGNVSLDFQDGSFDGLIIAGCAERLNDTIPSNGVIQVLSSSNIIADAKVVKNVLGNTKTYKLTYEKDGQDIDVTLGNFFKEPGASAVVFENENGNGNSTGEDTEDEDVEYQSLAGLVVYENWTKE